MSTATTDVTTISTPDIHFPAVTADERAARLAGVANWADSLAEKPENAILGVSVSGESVGAVGTVLQARDHTLVVDEPGALAGDDLAANPVEYALTALIACQVVSYRVWAAKLGITVDDIEVTAHGDLDTRGFFGVDDSIRPGFQGVNLQVRLSGPESEERYLELQAAVDAHCPVQDLFQNPTPFSAELVVV